MGVLKIFSSKELISLLINQGFKQIRQKGSHIVIQKKTADSTITVIVPNHKEIKRGTLQSIIRQSHLDMVLFEIN